MKKIIIPILIVFIFSTIAKGDSVVIPDEAIRFRVIANSNEWEDQQIKMQVKGNLEQEIYKYVKDIDNVEEAKEVINSKMPLIKSNISNTLTNNQNPYTYNVNLGINHFPQKEYKGVAYEEGDYDSLVVTLGEGAGDNWWCVLFPPLCLVEAEDENTDDVEYQFFVKKLIDKFMK